MSARTTFLLIHGIQGHPRQFQFLIDRLPEGTPYRNLLLPGHGADVKVFRCSRQEEWLAAVREAAVELRGQCDALMDCAYRSRLDWRVSDGSSYPKPYDESIMDQSRC